jgi:hypothetical protein
MLSCIIIAPVALLSAADQFAVAVGLPTGQFTVECGEGHWLCHFPPSPTALAALDGPLPPWLQVIVTDDPAAPAWDEGKVGVFLSASQDGWVHKATVDGWPRS